MKPKNYVPLHLGNKKYTLKVTDADRKLIDSKRRAEARLAEIGESRIQMESERVGL